MEKKRILQIMREYEFPSSDIANHYAGFFDESRYEVTTIYLSGSEKPQVAKESKTENILFWKLENTYLGFVYIVLCFRLYSLIRTKRFDVVICHSSDTLCMAALIRQFFLHFDLIDIVHDLGGIRITAWRLLSLIKKKWFLLLGVSDRVRDEIRQTLKGLPADRIQTAYPGLDYKRLKANRLARAEARCRLKLEPGDYIFASVESLEPGGGQKSLIRSFASLSAEYSDAKLVLLGSGESKQTLIELAQKLAITDRVIFKHTDDNPGMYFNAFDAIIWSSDKESFNPVLLEAMASGVTIIAATGSGGAMEIMADTGFLFKQYDVNHLSYYMQQVYDLNHSDKVALTKNTYARLKDHFRANPCSRKFWSLPITKRLQVH